MSDDEPGYAGGRPADGSTYPGPASGEWAVRESVVEYETPWYTGGYDLVEQPDGSEKRYYWAELPPAAVVVAPTDGGVVMVEQYRPPIRERHLELPAGIVESGESYTAAGERELREETGYAAGASALLSEFWVATGVLRHRRGIVYADGLEPVEPALDDNEFLTVRAVPIEDALSAARDPRGHDATLEGLLLAREEGLL